jgi:hypothetical protein
MASALRVKNTAYFDIAADPLPPTRTWDPASAARRRLAPRPCGQASKVNRCDAARPRATPNGPPIDQIIYAQAFGGEVSFTWKSRTAASVLGPKIPSVELLGALDKAQQAFRRWLARVLPHAQDRQARGDLGSVCGARIAILCLRHGPAVSGAGDLHSVARPTCPGRSDREQLPQLRVAASDESEGVTNPGCWAPVGRYGAAPPRGQARWGGRAGWLMDQRRRRRCRVPKEVGRMPGSRLTVATGHGWLRTTGWDREAP